MCSARPSSVYGEMSRNLLTHSPSRVVYIVKDCSCRVRICDSTWEKGPSRPLFQNRVIATAGKSRLLATKCAAYLVMKAKCSGVIAVSVHSFLSTAIS